MTRCHYKHAYDLDQNNIQILTQYVESIVLVKGKLPAILRKHGEIAWKNNPKDYPLAHALSLDDFARQRYVSALHRWENILKILPPGGKDSKMILQWIARAQRKIR